MFPVLRLKIKTGYWYRYFPHVVVERHVRPEAT